MAPLVEKIFNGKTFHKCELKGTELNTLNKCSILLDKNKCHSLHKFAKPLSDPHIFTEI